MVMRSIDLHFSYILTYYLSYLRMLFLMLNQQCESTNGKLNILAHHTNITS